MPSPARRVAVSLFVGFHLLALSWWNVGVMQYTPVIDPDDGWHRLRAAVFRVDRSGVVPEVLEQYVRGTALWQLWVMFESAPRETGLIEVRGIVSVAPDGRPTYDSRPVRSVYEVDAVDHSQRIGVAPCGFRREDTPRWTQVRSAYAHFYAEESQRARGVRYVALELICYVRSLPAPDEPIDVADWQQLVLWAGPFDRAWRSR